MSDYSPTVGAGPAVFKLVRFWSRRWASGVSGYPDADHARVPQVLVVEAVDTVAGVAPDDAEVTVADVAYQLGVDRSVASRMVADAQAAGLVTRDSSSRDARRARVRLTDAGLELLAAAHAWQQQQFDALVAGWDPADRDRLAGYILKIAAQVLGTTPTQPNPATA